MPPARRPPNAGKIPNRVKITPRVIVVGRSLGSRPGWEAIDADVDAGRSVAPTPSAPVVLVGGDDFIESVAPDSLPRLRHDSLRVILAPTKCSYEAFAQWVLVRRPVVTTAEGVSTAVKTVLHRGVGVREHFEPADWCDIPLEHGSAAWAALRELPTLDGAHDSGAWAVRLGWSRQLLWQVCREDLGTTPRDVMFRHVRARVEQARRRGYTVEVVAHALGYDGAANLTHAFKRRGLRIPPDGR